MRTIILTAFAISLAPAAAANGPEPLRVTVYNKASLSGKILSQTAATVQSIFRQSGIEIEWVEGMAEATESAVTIHTSMPQSTDQARRLACAARRDIALTIMPAAPSKVPVSTLGVAQPYAHEGINVRVYGDHVGLAAARRGVSLPELLGHAIAHEIGHVLLRSTSHDVIGLMAGVWNDREYGWINMGTLLFSREEAPPMLANLRGEGCKAGVTRR